MKTRILITILFLAFCGPLAAIASDERPNGSERPAMMPTADAISLFKERVAKSERDLSSKLVLGQLYIRSAKEEDKFHDLILAEEQFRNVLNSQPGHNSAKILLSYALLTQHRFKDALHWSIKYLESKPMDPSGLAIRFDAEMQLGKYDQAKTTIDSLVALGKTPNCLVRLASYFETIGANEKSLSTMKTAVDDQLLLGDTAENNAWFTLRYAQLLFDCGKLKESQIQTDKALKLNSDYPQALALLGRIRWSQGQTDDAIKILKKSIALSEEPPVLAQLGDLLKSLDRHNDANVYFQKAERMMLEEEKDPIAGPPHARERAVYFSNHQRLLDHAVELAAEDLKVRSDIHAHDVMAWSLHRAGRSKEALVHARKALNTNTSNATILFHSGMIEIANGNKELGRAQLASALESNPFFSPIHLQQIRKTLKVE